MAQYIGMDMKMFEWNFFKNYFSFKNRYEAYLPLKSRAIISNTIFIIFLLLSYESFATPSKKIALNKINDLNDFSVLRATPDSSTTARTDIVKFMVDRKYKRKLWFFDTKKYTYHYAFARDHLSTQEYPVADHATFNRQEYRREKRRFEMGSLVHYKDENLWVMQLIAGDTLSATEIATLFKQVQSSIWVGQKLHFLPMSIEQEIAVQSLAEKLPTVTADDVFRGIQYQPLTQGRSIGYLRLVKGDLDLASVKQNQILVLEKLPEEIPVSAAIISQELQAPLAHIALLCGSRGTPNMGLRNALQNEKIKSLDGKLIELVISPQEYSMREVTREEAELYWAHSRDTTLQIPSANRKEKHFIDVSNLTLKDATFAGAKAAQLGEVKRADSKIETPGGFVIPLAYYFSHLESKNISMLIDDAVSPTKDFPLAQKLESLQHAIESKPIDATLLDNIKSRMKQVPNSGKWILRSSTNAEDLPGFNGAGLYRSIKVSANPSDVELTNALRKVWSSVWLQTAFEEREWFGIDHRAVGMAVLVQPYVDNVIANGVAITANPFAEFRPGFLINAQPIGGSVTGAAGNEIPEQHLIYTYSEEPEFELISKSSRVAVGQLVLNKEALLALTHVLTQIHQHFIGRWSGSANAVDVEFLVRSDNKIIVLQARPYKVIYSDAQKMF